MNTATIIIPPPMAAKNDGISPYPIKTHTGFNTGSNIEIIEASTASILFNP